VIVYPWWAALEGFDRRIALLLQSGAEIRRQVAGRERGTHQA
jgi:hypothetical protein